MIKALAAVMLFRGTLELIRWDNCSEFVATQLRQWLAKSGTGHLHILRLSEYLFNNGLQQPWFAQKNSRNYGRKPFKCRLGDFSFPICAFDDTSAKTHYPVEGMSITKEIPGGQIPGGMEFRLAIFKEAGCLEEGLSFTSIGFRL